MAFNAQPKCYYLLKTLAIFLKFRLKARYMHLCLALAVTCESIRLLGRHWKAAIFAILLAENLGAMRWLLALAWVFYSLPGGYSREFTVKLIRESRGNGRIAAAQQ
jgi:hypothetical protein